MERTVYLNIGSNIGARHAHIRAAVAALESSFKGFAKGYRLSKPIESEAWGYSSQNRFINIGMAIYGLDLDDIGGPEGLLHLTQKAELSVCPDSHRNADGSYRDRKVDIDIICIDNLEYHSPRLSIPHPHMTERPFVMIPLTELKNTKYGN